MTQAMTSVQIENLNQIKQASYLKHVSKFKYPWDEHLNAQPGMKLPTLRMAVKCCLFKHWQCQPLSNIVKVKKQALDETDDVKSANVDIYDAAGDDDVVDDDVDDDADGIANADGDADSHLDQQHVDKSGGKIGSVSETPSVWQKAPALPSSRKIWRGAQPEHKACRTRPAKSLKGKSNLKGVSDARGFSLMGQDRNDSIIRRFNFLQEQARRHTSTFPRAASMGIAKGFAKNIDKGNLKDNADKRQAVDNQLGSAKLSPLIPRGSVAKAVAAQAGSASPLIPRCSVAEAVAASQAGSGNVVNDIDDEDDEVVPWAERQRRRGNLSMKTCKKITASHRGKTSTTTGRLSQRGDRATGIVKSNANLKSEGIAKAGVQHRHPMALPADSEKLRIFRLPAKARPPDPPRLPGKGKDINIVKGKAQQSVSELVVIDDDDDELVDVLDKLVDDIVKLDEDFIGKGNIGKGGKTPRAPQTEFANAEAFANAATHRWESLTIPVAPSA